MSFMYARARALILPAFAAFALIAANTPSLAHGYKLGALEVSHPWSRETAPGAKIGVGYLKVKNTGGEPDRLIAVETPAAEKVEIHESAEENGIAKMRPVDGVVIPAGGEVALAPGGLHLMLVNLKEGLAAGERVPATLVFEKAGRVDVELAVEEMGAAPAHKH
jgi:copper(I)-binding protein